MGADKLGERDDLEETKDTFVNVKSFSFWMGRCNLPSAAMCSLVLTGWKPTKGTCILASVPMAYHEE